MTCTVHSLFHSYSYWLMVLVIGAIYICTKEKISKIFLFLGLCWMNALAHTLVFFLRFHGHLNFPWTWTVKFKTSNKLGQLIIIEHASREKSSGKFLVFMRFVLDLTVTRPLKILQKQTAKIITNCMFLKYKSESKTKFTKKNV